MKKQQICLAKRLLRALDKNKHMYIRRDLTPYGMSGLPSFLVSHFSLLTKSNPSKGFDLYISNHYNH